MENRTRRAERIDLAETAVMRAAGLARQAENATRNRETVDATQPLAAAADAWTRIALAHAAIAQSYPADTDTPEA